MPTPVTAEAMIRRLDAGDAVAVLALRSAIRVRDTPRLIQLRKGTVARIVKRTHKLEEEARAKGINPFAPIALTQIERALSWTPLPGQLIVLLGPDEASVESLASGFESLVSNPVGFAIYDPGAWAPVIERLQAAS